ncbi:MAG: carbohydrate ABC transporter permease [Acidimicrobiales bacterium]
MSARTARIRRDWALAYLLLLPAVLIFAVFTFYPFLRNFKLALYENPPYPGLPSHYVGLSQVGSVLGSTEFHQSLVSTLLFVIMVVPAGLLGGLLLAVAAHRKIRGMAIYRMIFSSTVVSSVAVAAVVFGTLMDPVVGLLPWLGINPRPAILENPTWALPAVALIAVWQFLGLSFIIMTAGLQSLPEEVLEAAQLDGAGSWTTFWRFTVPLLSPTLFFALVVGTIFAFQSFGQIDILIGPQNAAFTHTNVLLYYIYQALSVQDDPGVAAVLSIVLFAILFTLTLLQLRFLERRVHYGGI